MYIVVSCRWRTAAGTHDLWRTEPTNDIRLNQVNRDCVTVTHTHLYINNHSPSTQFIYILFVPFHLSTCRNNPVRVRNIIEVFFFVIISSSYLFKRSRVQQRNSGGKNRKQRCMLARSPDVVGRRVGVFLSEFCCGAGHSIIESEQNTSSQRESVNRYRASGL